MKILKKMLGGVVAFLMFCVIATPSFAANITVQQPTDGKTNLSGRTFTAYQIFSGRKDVVDGEEVLSDVDWGTAFSNNDNKTALLTALKGSPSFGSKFTNLSIDKPSEIAKAMDGFTESQGVELAKLIYNALADSDRQIPDSVAGTELRPNQSGDYEAKDIPDGYYLIVDETETGSVNPAVLQVVGDITITPKTQDIPVGKEVKDNEVGEGYGESADYSIGDDVPFRLFAPIPDMTHFDTFEFKFHDTLSDGLTFNNNSIKAYLVNSTTKDGITTYDESELNENHLITVDRYDLIYPTMVGDTANNQKFTVKFDNLKTIPNVEKGKYIVIEYTAKLNSQASLGNTANTNEVYLEYSNNPNTGGTGDTGPVKVYVYTFTLNGEKRDGQNPDIKLEDARFIISKTVGNEYFYANVDSTGKIVTHKEINEDGEEIDVPEWISWEGTAAAAKAIGENGNIKSDKDGKFKIEGLDAGTYQLWETKAPEGYNTPTVPFIVQIKADHSKENVVNTNVIIYKEGETAPDFKDDNATTTGIVKVDVDNNKGTTLPETGGMGTTMLYIAGGILLVGSAVLLVTKKRMGHEG